MGKRVWGGYSFRMRLLEVNQRELLLVLAVKDSGAVVAVGAVVRLLREEEHAADTARYPRLAPNCRKAGDILSRKTAPDMINYFH
jgi:hypothetical protein